MVLRDDTTVLQILKEDLPDFNEIRYREASRIKATNVTQYNFIKFLIKLYRISEEEPEVFDAIWDALGILEPVGDGKPANATDEAPKCPEHGNPLIVCHDCYVDDNARNCKGISKSIKGPGCFYCSRFGVIECKEV